MAKQDRGFASMDLETKRRIASLGGKAAHAKGRAHKWTVEEARAAGRKGGLRQRSAGVAAPPPDAVQLRETFPCGAADTLSHSG